MSLRFTTSSTPSTTGRVVGVSLVLLLATTLPTNLWASDDWGQLPGWLGKWRLAPEIGRLVGAPNEDPKSQHPETVRFTFLVNKQAAIEVLGAEKIASIEERFAKMEQQIVAVGSWEPEDGAEGYADRDELMIVTTKGPVTFLWIGNPIDSLFGGEVHYMHGAEPEKDLLILDFGLSNWRGQRNRLFSGSVVGYQRVK